MLLAFRLVALLDQVFDGDPFLSFGLGNEILGLLVLLSLFPHGVIRGHRLLFGCHLAFDGLVLPLPHGSIAAHHSAVDDFCESLGEWRIGKGGEAADVFAFRADGVIAHVVEEPGFGPAGVERERGSGTHVASGTPRAVRVFCVREHAVKLESRGADIAHPGDHADRLPRVDGAHGRGLGVVAEEIAGVVTPRVVAIRVHDVESIGRRAAEVAHGLREELDVRVLSSEGHPTKANDEIGQLTEGLGVPVAIGPPDVGRRLRRRVAFIGQELGPTDFEEESAPLVPAIPASWSMGLVEEHEVVQVGGRLLESSADLFPEMQQVDVRLALAVFPGTHRPETVVRRSTENSTEAIAFTDESPGFLRVVRDVALPELPAVG